MLNICRQSSVKTLKHFMQNTFLLLSLVRMIYLTQTSAHDVHFKFEYVVTDT